MAHCNTPTIQIGGKGLPPLTPRATLRTTRSSNVDTLSNPKGFAGRSYDGVRLTHEQHQSTGTGRKSGSRVPHRCPDMRRFAAKYGIPVINRKRYTDSDVREIVDRLSRYDPRTGPAGSRRFSDTGQGKIPREHVIGSQRLSLIEIGEIVERLARFDPFHGPPDSKGPIVRVNLDAERPSLIVQQ